MMEHLGSLGILHRFQGAEERDSEDDGFTALRLFLAELLLTAGVQATVEFLRGRDEHRATPAWATSWEPHARPLEVALDVAPAALGPLAAAAQATRAFRPSDRIRTLTAVLNGAVIGVGATGLALSIRRATRGERRFSFTPLLFGYVGVLGLLLDREEFTVQEETAHLRRRARLVERWVPKRRTRVDRIVVHV